MTGRVAEKVCGYRRRLTGDLHVLVAEIELERLARRKRQTHPPSPDAVLVSSRQRAA